MSGVIRTPQASSVSSLGADYRSSLIASSCAKMWMNGDSYIGYAQNKLGTPLTSWKRSRSDLL